MPTLDDLRERFKQHRPRALRRDNIRSVPSGNVPSTEWMSVKPLPAWASPADAEILDTIRIKIRVSERTIERLFRPPMNERELRVFFLDRLLAVRGVTSLSPEEIKPIARDCDLSSGDFIFIVEVPRRLRAALADELIEEIKL